MKATALPETAIRRWTRAEYDRLIGLGMFEGERLELLDGWLVLREPQGTGHSAAIRRVLDVLRRTLGDAWQIDSQLPVALDDRSEPEPDVFVVPKDPKNHEYKASLYARASLPEYWIVDLVHETVEVHREPEASEASRHGWHYRSVETLRPPASVAPLLAPDRSIAVANLLP